MSDKPTTVDEYLERLPDERREVIEAVRQVILQHLPDGYQEGINYGMISYDVPLSRYPETYNGQPLSLVSIAAQKRHYSLYLNCVYQDPELRRRLDQAFVDQGLKPDMGKSCVRFTKLEKIPREVIGEIVGEMTVGKFLAGYEAARDGHRGKC